MPTAVPAKDVLDREFLEIRARILEIAASLDRLDRGAGSIEDDSRRQLIARGISILRDSNTERAEQVQMLFSRPFESQWRETYAI